MLIATINIDDKYDIRVSVDSSVVDVTTRNRLGAITMLPLLTPAQAEMLARALSEAVKTVRP